MSLLTDLRDPEIKRSKSAHKLAAIVLQEPAAIPGMSTATLANRAGVSEPTVNRFCTGLGYKGFPDFKLALAAELARQQPRIARDVEAEDSTSQVISKIFESTHASLGDTQQQLDPEALAAVVDAMHNARSIVLCGLGASASVALDAQHKLLRFPTPVSAHTDIINQRMLAASLTPQDCLLCISYTGRTTAIVELAQLGKQAGACVIGLTAPQSSLAKACDLVLEVSSTEDTDIYTPMSSRIAQLVIIDILATCLAQREGAAFSSHLEALKNNLASTREGA